MNGSQGRKSLCQELSQATEGCCFLSYSTIPTFLYHLGLQPREGTTHRPSYNNQQWKKCPSPEDLLTGQGYGVKPSRFPDDSSVCQSDKNSRAHPPDVAIMKKRHFSLFTITWLSSSPLGKDEWTCFVRAARKLDELGDLPASWSWYPGVEYFYIRSKGTCGNFNVICSHINVSFQDSAVSCIP